MSVDLPAQKLETLKCIVSTNSPHLSYEVIFSLMMTVVSTGHFYLFRLPVAATTKEALWLQQYA